MKNIEKHKKNIGCDVELGGITDVATIMKYGTLIFVGGTAYYLLKKWGSLKFFGNFGQNVKTIAKAPGEFSRAEKDVIDNAIYQANKALEMYRARKGQDATYKRLSTEWKGLNLEALKAQRQKVGFFKFYGGSKSNKELVANKIQGFVKKVVKEIGISKLQGLDACVPCLPLLFL